MPVATTLALMLAAGLSGPRDAPAPHCLDVRQLAGLQQAADDTLLATAAGRHLEVRLEHACPGIAREAGLQILAPGGWLCGGTDELLRTPARDCAVAAATPVSARDYAATARRLQAAAATALPALEIRRQGGTDRGRRFARGFAGTPDYCFNPTGMRAWTETPDGLQVEVDPRHNGGNRSYRIELVDYCPALAGTPELAFDARMGQGVVCGNPGDTLAARRESIQGLGPRVVGRCRIGAVYPVSR